MLLIREGDGLEVKNIALHKGRRGRGLGRATIEAVADLAREAGAAELVVGPADTSVDLHRFYRRCGFREDARRVGFFDAYPEPVVEDGVTAHDLIMFTMGL